MCVCVYICKLVYVYIYILMYFLGMYVCVRKCIRIYIYILPWLLESPAPCRGRTLGYHRGKLEAWRRVERVGFLLRESFGGFGYYATFY